MCSYKWRGLLPLCQALRGLLAHLFDPVFLVSQGCPGCPGCPVHLEVLVLQAHPGVTSCNRDQIKHSSTLRKQNKQTNKQRKTPCTIACHWGGTLKDTTLGNTPVQSGLKWICYVRKRAGQWILNAGPGLGTSGLDLNSRSFEDQRV